MLKSIFGPSKPVFDPALGDALAKKILAEATQGKITLLSSELATIRNKEWDRRAFYVELAGQYITDIRVMETLPDTSIGNLIRGSIAIELAWKARGGGQAETVSKEGWNGFFKNLDFAGSCLLRSGEQDIEDPTPFAFLQTVAMGLQLERKIAEAWLQEALKRDVNNQQVYNRHLFLLCKKWGGSHEEMFDFARATLNKIPPESTLNSIIYAAYLEYFLFLKAFERNIEGLKAVLHDKRIREESLDVYHKSLKNRKKIEQVSDYWPHNVTVLWFLILNIPEVVRQETQKIGPYFTKFPWAMFHSDPADGYHRAMKI